MMSVASWVADAVLALLLMGTLAMVVRLDRALRVVRRDRGAFETLITNLGSATSAVKNGIDALRGEAERAAEQIEKRSEEADKMATDLSFLIEAADRTGSKLEERMQAAVKLATVPVEPEAPEPVAEIVAARPARRAAGRFLLRRSTDAAPVAVVEMEVAVATINAVTIGDVAADDVTVDDVVAEDVTVEDVAAEEVVPAIEPVMAGADEAIVEEIVLDIAVVVDVPAPSPAARDLRELSGVTTRRHAYRADRRQHHAAPVADVAVLGSVAGETAVPVAEIKPAASIKMVG
jgi:hypothetical protein